MSELSFKFGTPEPVTFKEYCSDTEFKARAYGTATVTYYDSLIYGDDESAVPKIEKKIYELIPECFALWPEGKLIMGPDNELILNGLLMDALEKVGVTATISVRNVDLVAGQMDTYQEQCGKEIRNRLFGEIRTDDLTDKEHGPLISFSYNLSSHGMMAGSSSSYGDEISWNRDGSIILTSSSNSSAMYARREYKITPEMAQKVRDYVEKRHLAALAEKDIPTPMVYDNFTSSSICMTFDDSSVGGSPYKRVSIQCGPAGMTFGTIENEIKELIKECVTTGELVTNEEKQTGGMFGGFPGMMSGLMYAYWKCPHCGNDKNTGKFCFECGSPR